ncbi:MAG: DUF3108 domain-containing protein [Candidatus Azobacteroides sp.]|nr:DUF3108 domain-containing protein [Candidatus Azobacteroides sp.]
MKFHKHILTCLFLYIGIFCTQHAAAQCKLNDDFFSISEELTYDLHFHWGLLWVKAGNAYLSPRSTTYKGKRACKTTLTASTSGAVKKLMAVNDTLTSYTQYPGFAPLLYVKAAHEGKTDSYEEIHYEYPAAGGVKAKLSHYRNQKFRGDTILTNKNCFYDPVSMLYFVRAMIPDNMEVNQTKNVLVLFTDESFDIKITYRGKETLKLRNEKIKTVKYSFAIDGKAFENKKESLFLWVSDDENRIPVLIETKLKIGSLKASIKSAKGCKNEPAAFPKKTKIAKTN